jgi:hypothetical protein
MVSPPASESNLAMRILLDQIIARPHRLSRNRQRRIHTVARNETAHIHDEQVFDAVRMIEFILDSPASPDDRKV